MKKRKETKQERLARKRKKIRRVIKLYKTCVKLIPYIIIIVLILLLIRTNRQNKEIARLNEEVSLEKDRRQSIAELCNEALNIRDYKFQWAMQGELTEAYKYLDLELEISQTIEELSR